MDGRGGFRAAAGFAGWLIEEEETRGGVLWEECAPASAPILGSETGYDVCSQRAGGC